MTLSNKESGLNGEFANRKESLNGTEPAQRAIAAGRIDFNALRLSQAYEQTAGVEKLLTTVPVRKPNKTEFVRMHPEMCFDTMLLELKEDRESYLVLPHLLAEVSGIAVQVSLRLAINRAGVLFLWPLRLPGEDGRSNVWHESAREAADLAVGRWVSIRANMFLGAYDIYQGAETLSDPQWPDNKSIEDILEVAFRGHIIDDAEHPVIKRLQGRA
jgi:hypothetical protein